MRAALQAFGMVYREREFWPYFHRPLLGALIAYAALLASGFAFLVPSAAARASEVGLPAWLAWLGSATLFFVLWAFLSGPVFLAFAGVLSSLMWDGLSRRVESRLTGRVVERRPSLGRVGLDAALRSLTAVVFGVGLVLFGSFCFGLVAVGLAGFVGLADYTAPAFARRGVFYPRQPFAALRTRWGLPFGALAGVAALVPFINLLLIPGFVAAGTALCLEGRSPEAAPSPRSRVE